MTILQYIFHLSNKIWWTFISIHTILCPKGLPSIYGLKFYSIYHNIEFQGRVDTPPSSSPNHLSKSGLSLRIIQSPGDPCCRNCQTFHYFPIGSFFWFPFTELSFHPDPRLGQNCSSFLPGSRVGPESFPLASNQCLKSLTFPAGVLGL